MAESVVEVSQLPTSESSSPYFPPFKTQSHLSAQLQIIGRLVCLSCLFLETLACFLNLHANPKSVRIKGQVHLPEPRFRHSSPGF